METLVRDTKHLFLFGPERTEGNAEMKPLLGGKGANLAEMSRIGLPVPPGFTITTDVCTQYHKLGNLKTRELLSEQMMTGLNYIENTMGLTFGDPTEPLLLSVRSGARDSMPGMMDTVLDIGLNDDVVEGLAMKTGKSHFAWDSYRRFIQMYGDVVMKVNELVDQEEDIFEEVMEQLKKDTGARTDQDLTTDDLIILVKRYKEKIYELVGTEFPQDPMEQLWNSIMAVFESWHTPRAVIYRHLNRIPEEWGTAVNVQAMVFGNMGNHSASGVAFTRDAATGENVFNGEYLVDAQGEDVVAGIRTPHQITLKGSKKWAELARVTEEERRQNYVSLEEYMPKVFKELKSIEIKLESHFKDMQDLEFTIQENKLWILQTRNGKRTGTAMVRIGMEMYRDGMIDEDTLLSKMDPKKIDELLHPIFDQKVLKKLEPIAHGLPASPGATTGQIVFSSDEAVKWVENGKQVVLVRNETSPEDLAGMNAANGILTATGGMTSHAAVVARGMGKCCISGAGSLNIDYRKKTLSIENKVLHEGDWISLDGSKGWVFEGKIETINPTLTGDLTDLLAIADSRAKLKVRANADTPENASIAKSFGAEGIGLCRTEHMFFKDDRILAMREMIMAESTEDREEALARLLPMQRADFGEMMETMKGLPITIRLLDPPLHEFLPQDEKSISELAAAIGKSEDYVRIRINQLKEANPMMGHRGCRLGITYPEITSMQVRAIAEAAFNLKTRGIKAIPEIMVPLVGTVNEYKQQSDLIKTVFKKVSAEYHDFVEYKIGTMIEVPRAALIADQIAAHAEFFSFGTNDLTQMTFGFSRDDAARFLPEYLKQGTLKADPFVELDQEGVGKLVKTGVKKGRAIRKNLKIGICGEHGGDPVSVAFCHQIGLNYVSCSPYRVPIAKVAAARANLHH